jgi:hypothetical protein
METSFASPQSPTSSPAVKAPTHAVWVAHATATEQDAKVNADNLFAMRAIFTLRVKKPVGQGAYSSRGPAFRAWIPVFQTVRFYLIFVKNPVISSPVTSSFGSRSRKERHVKETICWWFVVGDG